MLGASKTSHHTLIEAVDKNSAAHNSSVMDELLLVSETLLANKSLLVALVDNGIAAGAKVGILKDVLKDQVSQNALAILEAAVGLRWHSGADLLSAIEDAAARCGFAAAENDGTLDRIEDEIFSFERIVASNGDLELLLSSPNAAKSAREKLIKDLVADKFHKVSLTLVIRAANSQQTSLLKGLSSLQRLAADRRNKVLAEVRTAIALDVNQEQKLTSALERIYNRKIRLQKVIDPRVVGGVSVQIGDELIDGTVASRLAQLAKQLAQ
jgi:F-type H+-transporting ATPase subunit delta